MIIIANKEHIDVGFKLNGKQVNEKVADVFSFDAPVNEYITANVIYTDNDTYVGFTFKNVEATGIYNGAHNYDVAVNTYYFTKIKVNKIEKPKDFKVEVIGDAYFKEVDIVNPEFKKWQDKHRYSYGYSYNYQVNSLGAPPEKIRGNDYYLVRRNPNQYDSELIPRNYLYLKLRVTVGAESQECEVAMCRPTFGGEIDLDEKSLTHEIVSNQIFYGMPLRHVTSIFRDDRWHYRDGWSNFQRLLKLPIKQPRSELWLRLFRAEFENYTAPETGIKAAKNHKEVRGNLSRLAADEPHLFKLILWLQDDKVTNKITNNSLISAMLLSSGKDYDKLKTELESVIKTIETSEKEFRDDGRDICLLFSAAKEKDIARREQHEWYLRKNNGEKAQGLGIDPVKHPKFYAAVADGTIPLTVFHNPGKEMELVNVEFDLWEKAFERGWGEPIGEIANNASRRSTYDKKVTPYISFLFKIESYLNKHAPMKKKPWRAIPKFVNTQWELEMEEVEEGKTAKRRSALTPVADNEARTITVPYAGIAIYGRQTTYCYSEEYYVFEENMIDPEGGGVVLRDYEERLNGRDDYGLMFYTLTGTPRNTGYPTFLIIFEKRKEGPFIHFHRVHPCRYKNGIPTPACRLVEECYRYMAGNVRAEEICAQQGDLMFIKTDSSAADSGEKRGIVDFESHEFVAYDGSKIMLSGNNNKSIKNRLGFIHASDSFDVRHPEHEWVKLAAGVYEVRRAKSWEANPTAVWSYTID